MPELMTVKEVARSLGVHQATIRRWIKTGMLDAIYVGPRSIRVDALAVYRLTRDAK